MQTCIHETTPVCARVELLHQLAVQGTGAYWVKIFSDRARASARMLASNVSVSARIDDWYDTLLAQESLKVIHQVPYVADPPSKDCYRDVEETAQFGGECKGLNILLVAVLLRLGIKAEVVWIMQPGKPLNHVSSVVWLNGKPLWADASIHGARVGETPYEALERTQAWHIVGGR